MTTTKPASSDARVPETSVGASTEASATDSTEFLGTEASSGAGEPNIEEPNVEEPDAEAAARKRPTGRSFAVIVAAVLVLALLGTGGWLLFEKKAAHDRDVQRGAFEQTARQTVLNLTTIKPDTAADDVNRILSGASGDFKAEFDGRVDPFVSIVQEAGVTTVGRIIESGIERTDGDTAQVLVAARADVSTPDGTQDGPRDFRLRVTVTGDGDSMSASKVEFVP